MTDTSARVVRRDDAKFFLDGDEACREYVRNATMWLGTSTLDVGQRGGLDAGHPDSIETWYCARGHVVIDDGTQQYELHQGDVLEIPPGLPHTLVNVGDEPAELVWAGAPGE